MGFVEINAIIKRPRSGTLRVALLYPSLYLVAADSLSYQMLYYYLNQQDDVHAERFVLDTDGSPRVESLETGSHLRQFDLIVVSVHYELDLVNILRFLIAAGIPPRSRDRVAPIIIAGGPPVIANPVPLSEYIDVLAVGEIEEIMPFFLEKVRENGLDKDQLLDALPASKGFYVPHHNNGEPVDFIFPKSLPREFHPAAQFQPLEYKGWRRRTAVETSRGCYRSCRFCLEGRIFNVMRERPLKDVIEIALEGSSSNKTRLVKLVSLSYFDHSKAKEILERLIEEDFMFSTPSFRAETLDEDKLELVKQGGQKTLVMAPETGSKRLALTIGKYLSLDRALEVAAIAKRHGFKSLKLYLMVGIPGETIEDLVETVKYIERISQESGFRGERELKLTVSPFVPKPHTPLQDAAFIGLREARRRIDFLQRSLGAIASIREYDPRLAAIQTVIARGDAEVGRLLLEWAFLGGGLGAWRRAAHNVGLNVKRYLGVLSQPHPWDFIRLSPRALWLKAG
jgi:radical SAM superfamily enzyme YgiQ (UPF0313 family)